jgi:hypothetical protein
VHRIVIPRAAKRCQAAEDCEGLRTLEREVEMVGGEFGDDGEATNLVSTASSTESLMKMRTSKSRRDQYLQISDSMP